MADFDDDLVEDIEEFDVLAEDAPKVISVTNELDIAVAAWHEDGRWTLGILPDPNGIISNWAIRNFGRSWYEWHGDFSTL